MLKSKVYQAARDVGASNNALVDIFARIECFFGRLEIYSRDPPTDAMMKLIVQIMAQVLEVLAVATKWMRQKSASRFVVGNILWRLTE
jgi:hypothetical protein